MCRCNILRPRRAELLSDEVQLGYALEAFAYAHQMGVGWATSKLVYLKNSGINNLSELSLGCKEDTLNLDLELFGVPPEELFSAKTLQRLNGFLPGPVGIRCFRLAQKAAQKVKKGTADTEYVHRPENGKIGEEVWLTPSNEEWVLRVDCAGFVRNCLKHVTKDPFVMSLSDRDFMRAKDFFTFFSSTPHTVMDTEIMPETDRRMKWRQFTDLRLVIPGDVICYRPKGNAAGGAAFTSNDRKDLKRLLKAVKTAQLWHAEGGSWTNMVTRNVAKDPVVKTWVTQVKTKLNAIDIHTVKQLHRNLGSINRKLTSLDYPALSQDTLELIRECCESTTVNTGHIVFASGPAVRLDDDGLYRIRVVHSTKYGIVGKDGQKTQGVQEYYRRFQLLPDGRWTRHKEVTVKKEVKVINTYESDGEDPFDDMEDDPEDNEGSGSGTETETDTPSNGETEPNDDLSDKDMVEVIVARMCF
ncbi:hypothetical protein FisN_36Hh034 [Fistulifera solaris]|jgi:hypothetical protein|uniref:Uncharacterized protein n=1 Tax=Fistulifera solaris TaxID=1519565 RepID=A0A1Z5KT79_FISSO|nr:hypothetical protein FisN_36Hh034 [Fistulifera solaris]|eukprot:GAX29540.1 hypothetical protein FisN_36Hh034 [Fistulifera solaris]